MGFRALFVSFVAAAVALALALLSSGAWPAAAGTLDAPAPGAWVRPVDGAVARPFAAPRSRYGAGHRGVDFAVVPLGKVVRAANAGTVSFAGSVAGSLHVVVAHSGGLRTSSSFLASVAVRRGQRVERGAVLGTTGGGRGDHAGVLHFGLRVGDEYVDPMLLFAPADLTRLIRLVPVDAPDQSGLDPPALERRTLAEALHLPRALPGGAAGGDGGLLGAVGDAVGGVAAVLTAPARAQVEAIGAGAAWLGRRSMRVPFVADGVTAAGRLAAWLESRRDCVADPAPGPGGGGSGHLVLTVAGINSRTDPATGVALPIDTERLGYRDEEVQAFSYAPDGGAYDARDTWQDVRDSARALGTQLRGMQREQPGREVDLVAHSQGGVVVAEYLAHHYDAADPTLPPLGTVVTLAAPLQGTPAATAAARVRSSEAGRAALTAAGGAGPGALPPADAKSVRQLAEDSRLVRRLGRDGLPEQIDLTTIGGADDVVVPANHASLPGARSVTVDPAGLSDHTAILRDPAALDAVRLALEARGLPCVGIAAGVRGAIAPVVISRAERTAGAVAGVAGDAIDVAARGGGR